MTTLARLLVLDLRVIAPYRRQALITTGIVLVMLFDRPEVILPALIILSASWTASYPFQVSDKAKLETLYAVLPVTRRSLLLGRYLWSLAIFVCYSVVGMAASLVSAHVQNIAFAGPAVAEVLAISWAAFALNISIQYPLYVRFGYLRAGLLGTILPIAVAAVAVTRFHLNIRPDAMWLALIAVAGAVLFVISAAVATIIDPAKSGTARWAVT
ncbi:ABC-2 transporter permease [Amycolatopsis saalfeldensis]|uniref:ABC-2 family transporter protein n=1 Tax=Amycolatopsis saalfeldensis TaxID=394193 RepID=A0A1H8U938_9PSEU|nr:ABC-2 transporter permease [Amycolatopsis saalfeldensis]SEO99782.1 ABC-2 family transporter protein [Amycolatopsis saalfeldensis]